MKGLKTNWIVKSRQLLRSLSQKKKSLTEREEQNTADTGLREGWMDFR